MGKHKETGLDFVVDKLTNSIENVVTGDSFATEVAVLLQDDLKTVTKAMKHKQEELDVDFIGGEGSLTAQEEKALSAYFQQKKLAKLAANKQENKKKAAGSKQSAAAAS